MINLSFCICENIWMTMGIFSTQVTSRSQQLNPAPVQCIQNVRVIPNLMWCSLKTKRTRGCWVSIHRMLKREGECVSWFWLLHKAAVHCRTLVGTLHLNTVWMAPPRVLQWTTCTPAFGTVCSHILPFVWLPDVEISQFEGNPNYRKTDPNSHDGRQRRCVFPLPHSLDVDKA